MQDDQEKSKLDKAKENILQQINNGSEQLSFAKAMAAFIGEQANDEYVAIFFPRDMALCYPAKRLLDAAAGKAGLAGLYYISRNNFAFYSWMANMIDNVASHTKNNPQKFLEEFKNAILKEMKNNEAFRKAIENIKKELDGLGYNGLSKVRFVDSGFKTFPLMMQALFGIFYPDCETKSLALASSIWALDQLYKVPGEKKLRKQSTQILTWHICHPQLGHHESAEDFLMHPFKYDSSARGMVPMLRMINYSLLVSDCLCLGAIALTTWSKV
jgi:hypothetical protein